MKGKSEWSFKRLLRIKTKQYAFSYLLYLKQNHSKMDNLHYGELKIQNYLKKENISVKEAQNLFRYRTRVAKFKENFKNNNAEIVCPLCSEHPNTQAYSVQCPIIRENVNIKGNYSEIFSEEISKEITQTLLEITKFRENLKLSPEGGPSASEDAASRCSIDVHLFELG